mmetsp:Transcript_19903/g.63338  ORF Transcript_19903/g.63338 Transcript_19903/m.63338 type:complete len:122 (+) Transcript_19903:79-444(+)|eukprot:CAMPEP_0182912228 /NCGR_PEP_ID=MMETSP0034_2-20130328/37403_1 /TAXON_ID=156128 /ORGANISM="Nephroselmis pyriformis, Strain CCMP717" /LENGTH=121 /DNA_ID=CAMNT_0025048885 /DNA_START=79 /DNA_END=444 /DNA_ORIENTATION=+
MEGADEGTYATVPTDFGNKCRACLRCMLVKTLEQFTEGGCDNCVFLSMEGDRDRVLDCTTTSFDGMVSMMDPNSSWASKWLRLHKYKPGCYALSVNGDLPEDVVGWMEENGYHYNRRVVAE